MTASEGKRQVAQAAARLNRARTGLHEAIRAAHAVGASMREIGRAAGLSVARIHQIIHRKDVAR